MVVQVVLEVLVVLVLVLDPLSGFHVCVHAFPHATSELCARFKAHVDLGLGNVADLVKVLQNGGKVEVKPTCIVCHDVDCVEQMTNLWPQLHALVVSWKGGIWSWVSWKIVVERIVWWHECVEAGAP